ncbi:hypothetical protein T12_2213 [Trichinella patagoniensis]|uniref:Uncharacterized protein n=1 Tax=Trichinella patagoniensis TaxID=990121 RepID=A0A0V0XCW4_9BILA|nr:hypothetical protein T12_2213 [Trichinella patagoniensis]
MPSMAIRSMVAFMMAPPSCSGNGLRARIRGGRLLPITKGRKDDGFCFVFVL